MKAWVLEEPGQIQWVERPDPAPGPSDVLVKMARVGLCGTDWHAVRGDQPLVTYPRVLGHELAGVVVALPSNGSVPFAVGDPVAILPYWSCGRCVACRAGKPNCCVALEVLGVHRDGGLTEYLVVPAAYVVPAPGLTLDAAAILEPLSIGGHAVARAGVVPGETILVVGAGPIGVAVAAHAGMRGARVYLADVRRDRLHRVSALLPDVGVLPADGTLPDRLRTLTDGAMPTAVFDATGNADSMARSVEWVAHGGRLVFVGLTRSPVALDDPAFHQRELTLFASRNATRADFLASQKLLQDRPHLASGYVTRRIPWERAPEALNGAPEGLKTLLVVADPV